MRSVLAILVVCLGGVASAATLEKLSLTTMIAKSIAIIRGKVGTPTVTQRGPLLYTNYPVAVSEVLRGSAGSSVTISIPGGSNGRIQQSADGAPQLHPGDEYVLVLWTSRSGLTQIIGLSQGLFTISPDPAGDPLLTRPPSTDTIIDPATRQPVTDEGLTLHLSALRSRIRQSSGGAAQ